MERIDPDAGTVAWRDPDSGAWFETSVKGGHCKLQWKADWAMRWYALGVDYEMSGKDLIDSVRLSSRICRILGSAAAGGLHLRAVPRRERPEDQQVQGQRPVGRRVAALRAAGDAWASSCTTSRSAPSGCISTSSRARSTNTSPTSRKPARSRDAERRANPAWHIHVGRLPNHAGSPISFAMLLNLASVVNADTPDILWGFIRRY